MSRRRTRGEGRVYKEPGRQWAIRWYENKRRHYRGGFDSKPLAERVLARIRGEIAVRRSGLPADPAAVPALGELAPDFLERRKRTHKAGREDGYRWKGHLAPWFGRLRPGEVDAGKIRAFAEAKLKEGLASGTIRIMVALLSSLFSDLQERKLATENPARGLPPSTMRLMRSSHDPKTTPFLERLEDVRRVFLRLEERLGIGFALGAFAGLRPGEAFALGWPQVDLAARKIHVLESVTGSTKDKESRIVPVLDPLFPVLESWKLKTGGKGRVVPPLRKDGKGINKGTRGPRLQEVLRDLHLARPGLGWYEATRHTFASQWAMAGRSLRELQKILGHSSIAVTERYAHLAPDYWSPGILSALAVDLRPGSDTVSALNGQPSDSKAGRHRHKPRNS